MKLLRQLLIILAICFIGETVHMLLKIPIPGNVIGMILLFICLRTGIIKVDMISEVTKFFLDNLAFFFIPAGVGLITCMGLIKTTWPALLAVIIVTTVIVALTTGYTVQFLRKERKNKCN